MTPVARGLAILRGPGERAHKYVLMVLVLFAAAATSVALASAFWVWFEQRFPNVGSPAGSGG